MLACIISTPTKIESRPLSMCEISTPKQRVGEVLLKVLACGICRTDLHVVEGDLEVKKSPLVPGHQIVGEVVALGPGVSGVNVGQKLGVAWLHHTCGLASCRFCQSGRENLCDSPQFTGWTVDGGFAQYAIAKVDFAYPIPPGFSDVQAAPLLCAGIIGYRSLELTGLKLRAGGYAGARLGIYGFGAAGHVVLQLARARGMDVFVMTRDENKHQALAHELGATWVGSSTADPPIKLDASIIFAPAGELIPPALLALDKAGVLVLGGIHMSPIPSFDYGLIYQERMIRSVANNTREDGRAFLQEAARIPIKTHVQTFSLAQTNEALLALKNDAIKGAGVLVME